VYERQFTVSNSAVAELDPGAVPKLPRLAAEHEAFHAHRKGDTGGADGRRRPRHDGDYGEDGKPRESRCCHRPHASTSQRVLTDAERIALPSYDEKRHEVRECPLKRPCGPNAWPPDKRTSFVPIRDGLYRGAVLRTILAPPRLDELAQ